MATRAATHPTSTPEPPAPPTPPTPSLPHDRTGYRKLVSYAVRASRFRAGDWSKSQLADELRKMGYQTSVSSVSRWERAMEMPSADVIFAVAKLARLNMSGLVEEAERQWMHNIDDRMDDARLQETRLRRPATPKA